MKVLRLILLIMLLSAGGYFLTILFREDGEENRKSTPPIEQAPTLTRAQVPAFTSSKECSPCHPAVYAEWESSFHAKAWTDPEVRRKDASDNFANKDCIPCHAPSPILETGLRNQPLPRFINRVEGVNCLTCHFENGRVKGTTAGLSGECAPQVDKRVGKMEACGICHNQHQTMEEWKESRFSKEGVDCLGCHMPAVTRKNGKPGRDHTMKGGHFPEMVCKAVSLEVFQEQGGEIIVVVKNTGGAHYVPTDARHRAMDLFTTFFDKTGEALPKKENSLIMGGPDGKFETQNGMEFFSPEIDYRFRNPYRDEFGLRDTRLKADEERKFLYSLPPGAARAEVRLFFKLTPYTTNKEAFLMTEATLEGVKE